MKCTNCNNEFEGRADAKFCSAKCRKEAFTKRSVTVPGTDKIVVEERIIDEEEFHFHVKDTRKDGGIDKQDRVAKYWYQVPLGAVPVYAENWPKMPEYMDGRQYFLWWKNGFKMQGDNPVIMNPYPTYDNVVYDKAGEQSRKWGS